MNYQRIYDSLIMRGKNRMLNGYSEQHHVLPRCLGGTDEPDNLVNLTPEEHYLCHQLLVKIYPDNSKLLHAAMFMTANGMGKRSNKVYGWLKRRFSEYMKGPSNPQKINPRTGSRHHSYNRKIEFNFTEEGRKILSNKMQGDKNPCAKIKPWNHPRATEYSKSVWKNADILFDLWQSNGKPSYSKLYHLMNGKCYTNETTVIGPYMNLVKYFRSGWVPANDIQWKEFNAKTTNK